MNSLRDILCQPSRFACGVELVTTRGTMAEEKATRTRQFATELTRFDRIDWVSITDNAGGNPQLSPTALGKPILYAGKEVVIHLSCKDFNRNGLESQAWQLASEGFHNILALSGDAPGIGYSGRAKSVFDIDSVGLLKLLRQMNEGMGVQLPTSKVPRTLQATDFFLGAVTTNFKLHEHEVIPQYLKLEKKIQTGAQFIITQIGYDARKCHEQIVYLQKRSLGHIPLIGNVFLLSAPVAQFFHRGRIPGVVVSDELHARCQQEARSPDQGQRFFDELAAKQIAIYRGLGYRGIYLGGIECVQRIASILERADSYAADDWKIFAREVAWSRPSEFFMYASDGDSGLVDPDRLHPDYEQSLCDRRRAARPSLNYRISKFLHDQVFTPGKPLYRMGRAIYSKARNTRQGPIALRVLEHAGKSLMFGCKDCGDCSLPDIAFLCPESACAKNQRNGPCGGTRDGKCEVHDFECIWSIAYRQLKREGREMQLLDHAPVIQDESLRGTSSWANLFLGRDHNAHRTSEPAVKPDASTTPDMKEVQHRA